MHADITCRALLAFLTVANLSDTALKEAQRWLKNERDKVKVSKRDEERLGLTVVSDSKDTAPDPSKGSADLADSAPNPATTPAHSVPPETAPTVNNDDYDQDDNIDWNVSSAVNIRPGESARRSLEFCRGVMLA